MLMISHDLAVIERVANRIAVMYRGKIVEIADTGQLIDTPIHPYTQALISAVPTGRPGKRKPRIRLAAEPSILGEPIEGCPFAPRCPEVQGICRQEMPELESKYGGHAAACHFR